MRKIMLMVIIGLLALFWLIFGLAVLVRHVQAAPELKGLRTYLPIVVHDPIDQEDVLAWVNENSSYTCTPLSGENVVCREDGLGFDLPFAAVLTIDEVHRYHLYSDRTLLYGCYPYGLCHIDWPD